MLKETISWQGLLQRRSTYKYPNEFFKEEQDKS